MSRSNETALVQQCLEGDKAAFEVLVERYQKVLYNISLRIVGNEEDALDATQTTFIKAYQKLDTFNPRYRFFSWIYRIAINESVNLVKKRRPQEPPDPDLMSQVKSPEEQYSEKRLAEQLLGAMGGLSLDNKCIIILKHFLDLSQKDMAYVLQIPEKTVKSRLYTARQQLGNILRRQGITSSCLTNESATLSAGNSTGRQPPRKLLS